MSEFQTKMRALIETHCETMRHDAETMTDCLSNLDAARPDRAAILAEGVGHAHKIKGSSGSIGFLEISAAAQTLEYHLRALERREIAPDPAEIARAVELGGDLTARIDDATPEQSSLYNAE